MNDNRQARVPDWITRARKPRRKPPWRRAWRWLLRLIA
jgi:hypothetical protein